MVYKTHHPHQMSQKYCSGLIYEVVVYERLIFAQTFETTITCTTPNSIILSKLMHHVKTNFRSSILTIIQSKTMPTIMTLMQTTSMSSVLLSDQPNGCLSFGFVQTTVVPIFQLFINIFQFIQDYWDNNDKRKCGIVPYWILSRHEVLVPAEENLRLWYKPWVTNTPSHHHIQS